MAEQVKRKQYRYLTTRYDLWEISKIRNANVDRMVERLKHLKRFSFHNFTVVRGPKNMSLIRVESGPYGPYWNKSPWNVRKDIKRALDKIGSSAEVEHVHPVRVIKHDRKVV